MLGRGIGVLAAALALVAAAQSSARAQGCSGPSDSTHACIGLDDDGFCDATCNLTPAQFIVGAISDTNFYPKLRNANALALLQQAVPGGAKRRALDNVQQILSKAGFATANINSVQDAIAAVNAAFAANGNRPIHLVIVGHGRPGSIKVGEDRFNNDTPAGQASKAKFEGAVRGKLVNLILVGCKTGNGVAGQNLLTKMSEELGKIEVHAWTGDIFPDPVRKTFWVRGSKKVVDVPFTGTVSDLHFVINSSQECPAPIGNPTAVGRGFITYKTGSRTGRYSITLTGALTSAQTAQHIHAGTATVCPSDPNANNRPVLITLNAPVSGTMSGTFGPLTAAQEAALLQTSTIPGQRPYINIHTANNPGGEIRGNLSFLADAPGGVPSLSEWGMIILAALLVVTGTVFVLRRRRALA